MPIPADLVPIPPGKNSGLSACRETTMLKQFGRPGLKRWGFASLLLLMLTRCVDTSAVTSFAQEAPDVSKLDALTAVYVGIPAAQIEWDLQRTMPAYERDRKMQETTVRQQQQANLDKLHAVLVAYMKALGGLSASKLTDVSGSVKSVTDGLTSLQKAAPGLGITSAQVSSVSDLVNFIGELGISGWRQYELKGVIEKGQPLFQNLVALEIQIVQRGIIPDIQNVEAQIRENETVELTNLSHSRSDVAAVTAFDFRRNATGDLDHYETAEIAAKAYVEALKALAAAHTALYEDRNELSSKTLDQILPFLQQAETSYQDLRKL
jgi:hypothetical protein